VVSQFFNSRYKDFTMHHMKVLKNCVPKFTGGKFKRS
jgi:hypothetical protein